MTEYELLKLDFLIAEKVMGFNRLIVDDGFNPSVDMEAAMAVVFKQDVSFQLDNVGEKEKCWRCLFGWGDDPVSATAETPSLAICYAALKLKGIEILGG